MLCAARLLGGTTHLDQVLVTAFRAPQEGTRTQTVTRTRHSPRLAQLAPRAPTVALLQPRVRHALAGPSQAPPHPRRAPAVLLVFSASFTLHRARLAPSADTPWAALHFVPHALQGCTEAPPDSPSPRARAHAALVSTVPQVVSPQQRAAALALQGRTVPSATRDAARAPPVSTPWATRPAARTARQGGSAIPRGWPSPPALACAARGSSLLVAWPAARPAPRDALVTPPV